MLAAPRAKPIRKVEKVFLIDLVEDGNHGLLDKFVFDSRDREWTLPSIFFLYVHSSRGRRSIGSAMNSAMKIDQSILQSVFILLPSNPVHSRCGFPLEGVKAFPQQIDGQMVEQGGELHLLILFCCFPHAGQPLGHTFPAPCRVRVRLTSVLLDQRPFLLILRGRFSVFVRLIHRCRVGGGALSRWPPSAAQTVHAGFPHTAFTKIQSFREANEGINSIKLTSPCSR